MFGTADITDMTITPSQLDLLSNLMDAAQLRHQVISNNVANVNTPGYQRLDVAFEEHLAKSLESGDSNSTDILPRVYKPEGLASRADGNNVDVDMEMGQLARNALLYQTYAQLLSSRLSTMRSAITGR